MSEKTVILETNSKSKKKNITWQPIRNGKTFSKYLNLNNKLEEIDRKNLTDDSVNLIGQTINPSIIDKVGMNSTGLCFGIFCLFISFLIFIPYCIKKYLLNCICLINKSQFSIIDCIDDISKFSFFCFYFFFCFVLCNHNCMHVKLIYICMTG